MNLVRFIPFSLIFALIVACNEDTIDIPATKNPSGNAKPKEEAQGKPELFPGQHTKDLLMKEIDSNKSIIVVPSLKYINNQNMIIKATAFLDKNGKFRKIVLEQSITTVLNLSAKTSYFYDSLGALRITKHLAIDNRKPKNSVSEITSYYEGDNANTSVYASFEKISNNTDSLDYVDAKQIELKAFPDETAKNVIIRMGSYETRFLGTVKNGELNFLIVGTNGTSGQRSTLVYDERNKTIQSFLSNQKKYLNRKVRIQFALGKDGNGMEIQTLQSISLSNE